MRAGAAAVLAGVLLVLVAGCGGDDGDSTSADAELVELLREEARQTQEVAACIAERVEDDERVDREALESIIRGEGTDDVATAEAYGEAALACASEVPD